MRDGDMSSSVVREASGTSFCSGSEVNVVKCSECGSGGSSSVSSSESDGGKGEAVEYCYAWAEAESSEDY